jgi:four helix bundle protein
MDYSTRDFDGVFSHQRLDAYRVALSFARWSYGAVSRLGPGRAALRDQLLRAAESAVLNVAEGAQQQSRAQAKRHYRIALGSAAECAAALDLMEACGAGRLDAGRGLIGRVGAMLRRLAR